MKCPNCGHNHPAREGRTCTKCHYRFVFEKKDGITDNRMVQLIKRLGEDGRYHLTRTQLALGVAQLRGHHGAFYAVVPFALGAVVAFTLAGLFIDRIPLLAVIGAIVGFMVVSAGSRALLIKLFPHPPISYREARQLLERYHREHPIDKLATGGAYAHGGTGTPMEAGYAPERVLVVEKEDLADALIGNGFHREHRCVVVTVDGYPQHVFNACREFVQRHPKLPIYLLHDASAHGFRARAQLEARPEWQFARSRIRDLGITREQLRQARQQALPWLVKGGETVVYSPGHENMLKSSGWVPVDYPPPPALQGALAAGLVAGMLTLPDPVAAGDGGGGADGAG